MSDLDRIKQEAKERRAQRCEDHGLDERLRDEAEAAVDELVAMVEERPDMVDVGKTVGKLMADLDKARALADQLAAALAPMQAPNSGRASIRDRALAAYDKRDWKDS